MNSMCLKAEQTVFILVDVQERLLPAMSAHEQVLKECGRLLRSAQVLSAPVLTTEQYPKGLGATVPELAPYIAPERTMAKTAFSCFGADGFEAQLNALGRKMAVVFGIESHICVYSTVMELLSRGYFVVVAEEACSSRNRAHHELAMKNMMAAGAAVLPVETIVYQLLYKAGTPEFKTLLPLFK